MRMKAEEQREQGFTLVEVLIVVAIVALLASIVIPALQSAMTKSKRNATLKDLRTLQEALTMYAADNGGFPSWGELDYTTLEPLQPTYLTNPRTVVGNLYRKQLDVYIPFNLFTGDADPDSESPQSFFIIATLAHDRDIRYLVTEGNLYYWIHGRVIPAGDN